MQENLSIRKPARSISRTSLIVAVALIVGVFTIVGLKSLRTNELNKKLNPNAANLVLPLPTVSAQSLIEAIRKTLSDGKFEYAVVNIWATWCEPCRAEMPELVNFQKSGLAPLFLVSADNSSDSEIARSFLIDSGVVNSTMLQTPIIAGDQQVFLDAWIANAKGLAAENWSMTLPTTFIVNAHGKPIKFLVGATSELEIKRLLQSL